MDTTTIEIKKVVNQLVSSVNLSEVTEAVDLVDLTTKLYSEKFGNKILKKNSGYTINKNTLIWKSVEEAFKKIIFEKYAYLNLSESQIEKLIKLSYSNRNMDDFNFYPEFSYESFDNFKDLIEAIEIYNDK